MALGPRVALGHCLPGRPRLSFHWSAACLCSGRPEWNACCTARSPGEGPPRVPRTALGGQPVPYHCALASAIGGPPGQGRQVPWVGRPVWALRTLILGPKHELSPVVTPCHSLSVVAGRLPWSVAFTIQDEELMHIERKSVALVSVATEDQVTQ